MTNLTLSIDDDLLRQARIRALERDTTVDALVRDYLRELVADGPSRSGVDSFLALTEKAQADSGMRGRSWTRDELHER